MVKMKRKSILLSVMLLVLVGIGVGVFLGTKQESTEVIPTTSQPETDQPPFPQDTINDGVYTNYEYGFRFKYDQKFFKKQYPFQEDHEYKYQEWSSLPGGYTEDVILTAGVDTDYPESKKGPVYDLDFYNQAISLKPGETFFEGINVKRADVYKNGVRGVVYFMKTPPWSYNSFHSYIAEWLRDDVLYSISIYTGRKEKLEESKKYFDQIVESFEFID